MAKVRVLASQLYMGYSYNIDNYTIYYDNGTFLFSSWEYSNRFTTLKEMKQTVKDEINIKIP